MIKRLFDIFFSILGIFILLPFFLIVSALILISDFGPIIFKQIRIGKKQVPFKIFKFRTMVINAQNIGPQITIGDRDPRVTKIGFFLRKYKLDELPQLFNVLFGQMSFVGPRPEVKKYVELYTENQKKVFLIRPGITDLASIEYRNESEVLKSFDDPEKAYIEKIMPEKLSLNLEYIKKKNLLLDIKLILKTLKVL